MTRRLIATCARGLEPVLADELRALGLADVEEQHGAVAFAGGLEQAYRACLWSRVASRVLWPVKRVHARTSGALYRGVKRLRWTEDLRPEGTLAVHFVGTSPQIRSSHFGALKVKDAIVDHFREATGQRPDVDVDDPDLRVHVFLHRDRAQVSIDLSGSPLHRRGHDRDGGPAPLKETLAAGILRFAEWHVHGPAGCPLVDPMCGSGTLLSEAADVLRDRAPGLARTRWGFDRWLHHDAALWARLRAEAQERVLPLPPGRLFGVDHDAEQVERCRGNLARAGHDGIDVQVGSLADQEPPAPGRDTPPRGLVVTNPPHGERLGDEALAARTWSLLGDVLRRRFLGWVGYLLAGSVAQTRTLGLRPTRRWPVFNGANEGRLLEVPIADRPVARDVDPD